MDASAVAEYLKNHPHFFEEHADVLTQILVPHPHGGHAIPLAERQILALRDKNHELDSKLRELISFGTENDAIGEKLHRATLALFAAPDLETTLAVLYHSLKEDFGVPQVAARLWGKVPEQSYLPELAATSSEIRKYADQQAKEKTAQLPQLDQDRDLNDNECRLLVDRARKPKHPDQV